MGRTKYWDGSKWVEVAPSAQEFDGHKDDGKAHGIGDKATLKTTNKTTIVAALNELFTNANDGKTAIASAVTAKGVTASPSDTFAALATKIGQINTGKKFATGTTTAGAHGSYSFTLFDGTTIPLANVTVNNLNFSPSTILLICSSRDGGYAILSPFKVPAGPTSDSRILTANYYDDASGSTVVTVYSFKLTGSAYVNATGFRIPVRLGGSSYQWIAIE